MSLESDYMKYINKTQEEKFPYFLDSKDTFGFKIKVNKEVFSLKYSFSWSFITPLLSDVKGEKRVLEIGSGCGISSLYMSRYAKSVLAVDINEAAVKNTKENAELNGVKNLEVLVSDVFSNVEGKFDTIYWNFPWIFVSEDMEVTPLERAYFDPGYKCINRLLKEGKNHLEKDGRILLAIGYNTSNLELFQILVEESGYKTREVLRKRFVPPNDWFLLPYDLALLELK